MCGIAGELQFSGDDASLEALKRVNLHQQHRGPDSCGLFSLGPLALGHRRLKIFDLSDRAAQPMVDQALGLALVFNGAIYNFPELRADLETKGYRFTSGSDTEVLLKAYHAWGESAVRRLHGMFAFAIWERDSGRLVLARDRLGIKPLYYAHTAQGFRFASTLPALLEFEGIDRSIDAEALHYYLAFHAVPEPLTLLRGIRKLPPGHIMTVTADGAIQQRSYWQLELVETGERSENEWLEETRAALHLATHRQLAADVPLGILLSGGLDSSLLVALAAETRGSNLETFSIGFESAGGEAGDEFYYSDMVARHFGTRHHQHFISNPQLTESLADCVRAMSEPMVSHDNIGFYLLSHEVAKHVRVVLSGQGADEMFAGYRWFQEALQPSGKAATARKLYETLVDHSYADYRALVTPAYRTPDLAASFLEKFTEEYHDGSALNPLIAYESTFALANGPLGRVDNMTMAASLEARVPFLDEAVVDLARRLPLPMKLSDGGKYILKALGRQMLPRQVVDRPKGYFPVPALKYLGGPTLALMRDVLTPERIRERGLFEPAAIAPLLAAPEKHLTPLGASKLWQVGLLEYWLQLQGI